MDAACPNYEEQYTSIPQYIQTTENSVLNSSPLVDDFKEPAYQSPEQLQQKSWLQRIRWKLAHKRSNRKQKAGETAIAKSSENDFENADLAYDSPSQESRWQRFKRFFSHQKPTEINKNTDHSRSFESSDNYDAFQEEPPIENSTLTEGGFTDGTENSELSSSTPSEGNATNSSNSFAGDYSGSDTDSTESPAPELYKQRSDQDLNRPTSFELSTPRQSAPIRSSDEFEQTLNIYAQQISSGEYNVTAMPCALIDLYKHNMAYLNNPWYSQVIENLLSDWVSQVTTVGRKMFRKCHWGPALTPDFMNFLAAIDRFLSEAVGIDELKNSQAFEDLATIVNTRFIDWFRLLIHTPGVNLEQFFNTINDCWGRFHSIPIKQLMIQVSDLNNNDDRPNLLMR